MARADTDRFIRENLQCDGGVGERLSAKEHVGLLEPAIVTRSTTHKLIHAASGHRHLVHHVLRMAGQPVNEKKCSAVAKLRRLESVESAHQLSSGVRTIYGKVACHRCRESHLRSTQCHYRRATRSRAIRGEFTRG